MSKTDGLTDACEKWVHGTDPDNPDTDGDGLPDGWEAGYGLDTLEDDAAPDPDGDGLTNLQEYQLGTNPCDPDTDGDGLTDGGEAAGYGIVEWGEPYAGQDAVARPAGLCGVAGVSAGFFHVLAVHGDGTVTCWGKNDQGQCSPPADATNIVSVAAGAGHSVALRSDGTVVCWGGAGVYGESAPPASATNVSAVAAGGIHSVALRADGSVVCWGMSVFGQTLPPSGLTNAAAVAAGTFHTAALTADGRVVCWGDNTLGQCAAPPWLTNAVAVAAGSAHTVALTAGGQAVCWGGNPSGQTEVPQGLAGVTSVGAGRDHTLACAGTGDVVCWGANGSGQSDGRSFTNAPVRHLGGGATYSLAMVGSRPIFTDPLKLDTDGDGLADGDEVNVHGTDPLEPDTDGDGIPDGWELRHGFNPLAVQTDGTHGAGDDPDYDGLDNLGESGSGTDPFNEDTDGDGKPDGWEVEHGFDPVETDTDGDGMSDWWELRHGFNPLAVQTDGTHGAGDDPDGDGLDNLGESGSGTDPFDEDTDGDGLTDGAEVHVHGTNPLAADTDGDGIGDASEIALQTVHPCLDPLVWDSDGDMLPDGWEVAYGLSPCGCATTNSAVWDADNDGLGLFDEYRYCTDPFDPDTDGDGVSDGDEVPHSPGSCPIDASDGGDPANCVTLKLTVGDSSGSHSERWNLEVFEQGTGKAVVRHCDDGFGTPGSAEYALVKGKAYAYRMRWVATDPGYTGTPNPDYDWRALINDSSAEGALEGLHGTGAFIVEDPDELLQVEKHGNAANITLGKEGRIIVPKIVTETVATSPPDRARKTIGVGEEVSITLLPEGISGVLWNMTAGAGQISGYTGDTITFTAPDRAADNTLTVEMDAVTVGSVMFHVIEPEGIMMENKDIQYASSGTNWVAIKYWANIYLVPSTVNFYNADIYEGSSPVYTNGYFCLYDTKMQPHGTNGPHHMLEEVVDGKGTLCKDADEITGIADIIDTHISGDLYWIMNWSFAVGSGEQKEIENFHIRQNNHIDFPDDMATLTVTKDRSGYSTVFGTNVGTPVNP